MNLFLANSQTGELAGIAAIITAILGPVVQIIALLYGKEKPADKKNVASTAIPVDAEGRDPVTPPRKNQLRKAILTLGPPVFYLASLVSLFLYIHAMSNVSLKADQGEFTVSHVDTFGKETGTVSFTVPFTEEPKLLLSVVHNEGFGPHRMYVSVTRKSERDFSYEIGNIFPTNPNPSLGLEKIDWIAVGR